MKPNDIVKPSKLCVEVVKVLKPHHRGIVLAYPDRYKTVKVKWNHKRKPAIMAQRYVEPS